MTVLLLLAILLTTNVAWAVAVALKNRRSHANMRFAIQLRYRRSGEKPRLRVKLTRYANQTTLAPLRAAVRLDGGTVYELEDVCQSRAASESACDT